MATYRDRLRTEAALQAMDDGDLELARSYWTLATIARQSAVVAAVNRAREVADKDHWYELARPGSQLTDDEERAAKGVLDMMPGYCCLMDAVAIIGRL